MGKQYNKTIKRRRRQLYLKRKNHRVKAAMGASSGVTRKKKEAVADSAEVPKTAVATKKAPAKKAAAKKAPVKKKAPAKKAAPKKAAPKKVAAEEVPKAEDAAKVEEDAPAGT